ncbi:FAD/FMN-containing dehydrogenase [Actinoplanes lutulentus]|uniref:FAD/FMN-containing dehydrogenase n=1 Tax=Actinoplanes lutulentus TaxID=1287878 RepID=A0A327ZKX5_9ACTN|nr:FAD-binding oxidoreductase [Actinoplanes lutulentus]MBB2940970.1 FAD/FMN-containing dehydrogenase [Actinoplanes lutulentus]RAK43279.1 FAD/FMN-containing dehydrogenase [Actinoplanes lutulentus]
MLLSRRAVLGAGAAALTGAGSDVRRPVPRPSAGRTSAPDWTALAASLDGRLELPDTALYERTRQLADPRFDPVHPPAIAVVAHAADVAEVVRFARAARVAVVTRGGGHSYVGASTTAGGVVLDLRGIQDVRYDWGSGTAAVGGGARLGDVYDRLGAAGRSIPSGSCGTVGISGITLGGGIGMAASAYGLTCDAVVEAEVVTADGNARTVDAQRERDLFWALRGGGGGQFGVVTGWRMRTHRVTTTGTFVLNYPWGEAARVAAGWQARLATAPDETWSTCQFASDRNGRLSVRISGVVLEGDPDAEAAEIARAVGREPALATLERRAHLDVVHDRAGEARRRTELAGSEIFRWALPEPAIAELLATVERRARARKPGVAKFKRLTGAAGRVAADATAFPWRGAHTMLQWLVLPGSTDPAAVQDGYAWIESGHRVMSRWSAGRYVNYLEPSPAVLPRYYGPSFSRLRWIRATVDPQSLFRSPYAL